jgi:hypothetical protein
VNNTPIPSNSDHLDGESQSEELARRNFLKKTGRFAVVTPAAITLLLGTSLSSRAIAGSAGVTPGGHHPKKGWGRKDKRRDRSGSRGSRRSPFNFF